MLFTDSLLSIVVFISCHLVFVIVFFAAKNAKNTKAYRLFATFLHWNFSEPKFMSRPCSNFIAFM